MYVGIAAAIGLICILCWKFLPTATFVALPRILKAALLVLPILSALAIIFQLYQGALVRMGKNYIEIGSDGMLIGQSGRVIQLSWHDIDTVERVNSGIGMVFRPEFARGKVLWDHNLQKTGYHYTLSGTYEVDLDSIFQEVQKAREAAGVARPGGQ